MFLELDVVLNNLALVESVFVFVFDLAVDVGFEASLIGVYFLLGYGKLRHCKDYIMSDSRGMKIKPSGP